LKESSTLTKAPENEPKNSFEKAAVSFATILISLIGFIFADPIKRLKTKTPQS
jgi:hypothetical protein